MFLLNQKIFSIKKIQEFKKEISSIILNNGIDFFEIKLFEKKKIKIKLIFYFKFYQLNQNILIKLILLVIQEHLIM